MSLSDIFAVSAFRSGEISAGAARANLSESLDEGKITESQYDRALNIIGGAPGSGEEITRDPTAVVVNTPASDNGSVSDPSLPVDLNGMSRLVVAAVVTVVAAIIGYLLVD